jgi:hypothetical protein
MGKNDKVTETKRKKATRVPPDDLRERMELVDSLLRADSALDAAANDYQSDDHQLATQLRQAAIDFADAWRALVWGAEP